MILLAGGSGTAGRVVAAALQDAGMPFRILTRSPQSAADLQERGVLTVLGTAENPDDADRAVSGCTAVVSAISAFGPQSGSTPAAVDRDGNINLMEAAARAGVKQFVHFSMHGASASHPLELARMKYAAEQRLVAGNLDWTILRPTTILETYAAIMGESLSKSGVAVVFGRGDNPVNFVSALDLAAAAVFVLHGGLKDQAVDIGGPDNLPLNELADLLVKRNGSGRTVHVPLPVLRIAAAGARLMAPPWGRVLGGAVNLGSADMRFDAASERAKIPGVPFTPVREALAALGPAGSPAGR